MTLALCAERNTVEALWSLGDTTGPIRYGVLVSGALTYDFETKETFDTHSIDALAASEIVKAAKAEQVMVVLFYPDVCICRAEDAEHMDLFHMSVYQSIYHFKDDLI